MKALISALIFALLFVALTYHTQGLWENTISSTLDKTNMPFIGTLIGIKYCLISGLIISLAAFEKGGFGKLKDFLKGGLIDGLVIGLVLGLLWGLISWMIFDSVIWLISGLAIGLVIGLVAGLINEQ